MSATAKKSEFDLAEFDRKAMAYFLFEDYQRYRTMGYPKSHARAEVGVTRRFVERMEHLEDEAMLSRPFIPPDPNAIPF